MAIETAVNAKGLIATTRGTLFVADATNGEVALPANLSGFSLLDNNVDNKWFNIGHTSSDNKLEISMDGGDAETKSTWLMPNARTTYSNTTIKVTGKSVQGDKKTLQFIYNGWTDAKSKGILVSANKTSRKLSMLILAQDDGANLKFGMYLPLVDFTYDGLPSFSGDNFLEFGFSANVLTSTTLQTSASGQAASYALLAPEEFGASADISVSH